MLRRILLNIWELPQTLLSYLLIILFHKKIETVLPYKDATVYYIKNGFFSVCLGRNILLRDSASVQTLNHEYGHSVQSKYLGPLYLIVVGIPSIALNMFYNVGAIFLRWDKNKLNRYYQIYPESWADKLGKVERD